MNILKQIEKIANAVVLPEQVGRMYNRGIDQINHKINNPLQSRPNHLIVNGRHFRIVGISLDKILTERI